MYAAKALKGSCSEPVITVQLQQMVAKGVWHGIKTSDLDAAERRAIIRSSTSLRDKYCADGSFEKFKVRLVAGGHGQDKELYEKLPTPPLRSHHC